MKKLVSVFLCAALLLACCAFSVSAQETGTVCSSAADMLQFVIIERSNTVPLRIVPATLTTEDGDADVYLIGMLGVKSVRGQVNSVLNCFFAAFNRGNSYYDLVKNTIRSEIPAGSSLVFACHSLGGMVAQQLRTDADLIAEYEIVNVLTAGSPYVMVKGDGEGTLHRIADKNDAIPYLSPATVVSPVKQLKDRAVEDGGYTLDPDGAHNLSYLREDLWGAYDVFGVRDGGATLRFDPAAVRTFGAAENAGSGC